MHAHDALNIILHAPVHKKRCDREQLFDLTKWASLLDLSDNTIISHLCQEVGTFDI